MPRFHFHLIEGNNEVLDEVGQDLPSMTDAQQVAVRSAQGLMGMEIMESKATMLNGQITVVDDHDRVVCTVVFSAAITATLPMTH